MSPMRPSPQNDLQVRNVYQAVKAISIQTRSLWRSIDLVFNTCALAIDSSDQIAMKEHLKYLMETSETVLKTLDKYAT